MAPVLGYWKIRGLAQPIRLMLHYVGEDYEDKMYDCGPAPDFNRDSWLTEKFKLGLDFPNLPYYMDGDVKVTQSSAVTMHIARKHNLCGETEVEKAKVDMILAETVDLNAGFIRISYNPEFEKLKGAYIAGLPDKLKQFETVLGDNPWFLGKKVTVVDFPLYELLCKLVILESKCLDDVPKLKAFVDRFENLPEIKKYMESDAYEKLPMNNKMAVFGNKLDEVGWWSKVLPAHTVLEVGSRLDNLGKLGCLITAQEALNTFNLPYYMDGDVKITQSSAVTMHIARKHNLCGETEVEKAKVDMIIAEVVDLNTGFIRLCYNPEFEKLKVAYIPGLLDKLKEFETVLGDNPWFLGKKVTVVDFPIYEVLYKLLILEPKCVDDMPKLKAFIDRFENLPEIKKYMELDAYEKLPINNKIAVFGNKV